MHLLFLEPFYGGSHKDFADGLCRHSSHCISLYTLPDRFWKWRMRGAALAFLRKIPYSGTFDAIIMSNLMSAADFRALFPGQCPPLLVYFHENQLSYPVAREDERDMHFGFTDITTALAADRVLFNSRTHSRDFFSQLPAFLRRMPDLQPLWAVDAIGAKSAVCYPGCAFSAESGDSAGTQPGSEPLIVWNHRWEFDKQPEIFFAALEKAAEKDIPFSIGILGEAGQTVPPVFDTARTRFGQRIRQFGGVADKQEYFAWLQNADVVVSTAIQENFGISVVEAMRFGCLPLLPDRLSYPEILPARAHSTCLYGSFDELVARLCHMLTNLGDYAELRRELAAAMRSYAWQQRISDFDREFADLAAGKRKSSGPRAQQL